MAHSFLIESGSWTIEGHWIERDGQSIPLRGKTLVSWGKDEWFVMVTKLIVEGGQYPDLIYRYKGRFENTTQRYSFVMEHSLLGKVEGEGWLAADSIVQRYWALKDPQRRSGFDTLYCIDRQTYHWSSAVISGHRLTSALEAKLSRNAS